MSTDFDKGFEQGSIAAANVILAYLNRRGESVLALQLLEAWEDGSIAAVAEAISEQPAMTREAAKSQGFTGDACTHCGSMKMQIAGHCQVCTECGTSTGCS
jgi:hypothetical protein